MDHSAISSPLVLEFEQRCKDAEISPSTVLRAAGVHPTLWAKWRSGKVSPTLRSFEAAQRQLEAMANTEAA